MSRVIVKGLPVYYTENNLRKLFSDDGQVTDVNLRRKRNGESRRFAFIGFKTMDAAENAVRMHDGTFVDTARVSVQMAKTVDDPTLPLSWKEKRKRREREMENLDDKLERLERFDAKKQKKQKKADILDERIKNNPDLQEYMQTMKVGRSWDNDEVVMEQKPVESKKEENSDDEYEELEKPDKHEKMIPLSEFESKFPQAEAAETEKSETETAEAERAETERAETDQAAMDDFEWFKSKRTRIPDLDAEEDVSEKEEAEKPQSKEAKEPKEEEPKEEPKEEPAPLTPEQINEAKIGETGRLFLRNILYSSNEKDFRDLFENYGELSEVHVAVDTRNGSSKGFAYIQFKNPKEAIDAYQGLDKKVFQGRLLHILPGKPKKENKLDEFALQNMPLKKQRLLRRKYNASKNQFSWNSLYMNNDAVLESVASELGVSKSELIDPENSSSAVKQALAEAHVIGDVRKYFEGKGVDLTKFQGKEKDDKVILVKNFTHGTTKEDIGEKFSEYGQLNRILMPPAGTICILEFRDAPSGRSAFSHLAYKRMGTSILYLEKGPKDLFTKDADAEDGLESVEEKPTTTELLENEEEEEEEVGSTTSVFVKNLNFSTTQEEFASVFKALDGYTVAVIKMKPDPRHDGQMISMGFGFVEFKTVADANAAIKALDGFSLHGHKLELKLSTRKSGEESTHNKKKKSAKSSKIIVKNLPFEATRKDLFELFSSFGNLKSVRVPKKFDKSARGFGFVEFLTPKEAETVMDQLQGVHLLGRRLVLDYASKDADNAEEEIEKLTRKAQKQTSARKMAEIREGNSGSHKLDLDELEQ